MILLSLVIAGLLMRTEASGLAVLQPTTTIECGTTIQIEFYATENNLVSGDDKVRLSLFATSGVLFKKNSLVTVIGEFRHDAKTVSLPIPKPLPQEWLNVLSMKSESKTYRVFVRAEKVTDAANVNSIPGFFDTQDEFFLSCCPLGDTQCLCRSDQPTCNEAGAYCLQGRCASGAPPPGSFNGKCRATAPFCDDGFVCLSSAASTCVADNVQCPAGNDGCPCNSGACNRPSLRCNPNSNVCAEFAPTTADLIGAKCSTGDQSACYTSKTVPLSCKNDACAMCTPGDTACTCTTEGTCNGGVPCERGHCGGIGMSVGCVGCPCRDGTKCNGGASYLVCKFGRCEEPTVGGQCEGGGQGCLCVTSTTGRKGCTQLGLFCDTDNVCKPGNTPQPPQFVVSTTTSTTTKRDTSGAQRHSSSSIISALAIALIFIFVH
jgi:hypothetical protein